MPRLSGALDIAYEAADPSSPQASRAKLYFKSDGLLYQKLNNGTVTVVGAPNLLTTDTAQSVTAKKTFTVAPQVGDPASTSTHALVGARGGLLSLTGGTYVTHNLYYDGTNWRFLENGFAVIIGELNGYSQWWGTVSGLKDAVASPVSHAALSSTGMEVLVAGGFVKAPLVVATGVSGSSTEARFLGKTTGAAPTTGTWAQGDYVVTQTARIWVCTVAGTPGTWIEAGDKIESYVMAVTGALTVRAGASRIPLEGSYTVESIRAAVSTAPTGASVIVDVNKNGTTLFTTQGNRPTIAISGFLSTVLAPDVTTFVSGDYLTVDLDQIGSTIAGSDLTVTIRLRRTS